MPRAWMVLPLVLLWQAGAQAMCPPPPDDAAFLAAGGAIVSGRIVEIGAPAAGAYHPPWTLLEVTQRHAGQAPARVRLLAASAGLYTPIFALGQTLTFAIRHPFGESAVTICDARQRH